MLRKLNYIQKKIKNNSTLVNQKTINKFISNPDFPYLISFGRTGSHWLRTIMELYFEKPSLVRVFFLKKPNDFTCFHDHDMSFITKRKNVIYLYRNPEETIYSQINYHKLDYNNESIIKYWTYFYGLHLEKWLIKENFTDKKTIITYEGMKKNMSNEFKKICEHLNEEFNEKKLKKVLNKISKEDLKKRTKYDEQVVNLSKKYQIEKEIFIKNYSRLINESLESLNPEIKKWIKTK